MDENTLITDTPIEHADYAIACDAPYCANPATHFCQMVDLSWFQCDKHFQRWVDHWHTAGFRVIQNPPIGIHFTPIDQEATNP